MDLTAFGINPLFPAHRSECPPCEYASKLVPSSLALGCFAYVIHSHPSIYSFIQGNDIVRLLQYGRSTWNILKGSLTEVNTVYYSLRLNIWLYLVIYHGVSSQMKLALRGNKAKNKNCVQERSPPSPPSPPPPVVFKVSTTIRFWALWPSLLVLP